MINQNLKNKKISKDLINPVDKYSSFENPVLEAINLNVSYGKVLAVKNVNIQVPKNKVISLLGFIKNSIKLIR